MDRTAPTLDPPAAASSCSAPAAASGSSPWPRCSPTRACWPLTSPRCPTPSRRAGRTTALAPRCSFRKHGQSGIEVSDLLPHTAGCIDDLCVLRGCHGDSVTHPESVYLMNTGSILMGRPSLGAWVSYGLGTENRNMPAFVVMPDPGGWPKGGAPAWGNGFLPAAYQGTLVRGGASPVAHLAPPPGVSDDQQRRTLDFVAQS